MRTIKFRGLRTDGKGWHYGDLVHNSIDGHGVSIRVGIRTDDCYPVEVHPETVGQFTGLTDKNGSEIWEGDRLSHRYYGDPIVVWQKNGSWKLRSEKMNTSVGFGTWAPQIEIIGNIHEQ